MDNRNVYLFGDMNEASVCQTTKDLLELDQLGREPIRLFLMSSGGRWCHARQLYYTLARDLVAPVITIGKDFVYSGATAVLMAGNMRLLYSGTEIQFHKPYLCVDDLRDAETRTLTDSVFAEWSKDMRYETRDYAEHCLKRRGTHLRRRSLSRNEFIRRMLRTPQVEGEEEYVLKARHAVRLGFADAVIRNHRAIAQYEAMLTGLRNRRNK